MVIRWMTLLMMGALSLATIGAVIYRVILEPKDKTSENKSVIRENDKNMLILAEKECVITVLGNRYEVTKLAENHSGPRGVKAEGGFFKCGSDMSQEYIGEHGKNLQRLAPYLLTGNSIKGTEGQSDKNVTDKEENEDD